MSGSCQSGREGNCLIFILVAVFVIPLMFMTSLIKNRVIGADSAPKSDALPESFNGFALGASPDDYFGRLKDENSFELVCDCGFRENRVYKLLEGETFEGFPCRGSVSFKNDGSNENPLWRLYEVVFYSAQRAETLVDLMTKKYGAPANDDDLRSTWTTSNCWLTLQKRALTTNEQCIVKFYTDERRSNYESAQHSLMHKDWPTKIRSTAD